MNRPKLLHIDSIQELALFGEIHDLDGELEEVVEPVFRCDTAS